MSATTVTPAEGISLSDIGAAMRRRKWPMLIAAAIVVPIATAAALLWPATYRSTATILIEQQEVPTDLVRSTISSFADQRLQVINQRVMTTANLMQIVEKYNLYAAERSSEPREAIIADMRESVRLDMISADVVDPRAGRPVKATIAFTLSFDSDSAATAAQVANELTTLYLRENIETRRQLTADTANFLNEEANRLSQTIAGLETRVAEFKQLNSGNLPDLAQVNVQLLSRAEEDLRDVDARLFTLDQQLVFLDSQLAQVDPLSQVFSSSGEKVFSPADRLKAAQSELVRAAALYSPDHPDVLRLQREVAGLEREVGSRSSASELARQLADAEGQLVAARERYGAGHPDVVRLERLVDSVAAAMRTAPEVAAAMALKPDNPAYIQLSTQRETTVNERGSLQQQRVALQTRIADFEQRMSESPEVEREYGVLIRELEGSQQKYREVRQKQMEAQLAQNLESESKGERFTLIEPPLAPQEPFTPNRPAIFALGIVLALAVAVATMLLLEALDSSIKGPRDIERLLTEPPLAVVPWMATPDDMVRQRRQRNFVLAGAAGSLVLAMTAAHFLYRPLDVLWLVALRKFGG